MSVVRVPNLDLWSRINACPFSTSVTKKAARGGLRLVRCGRRWKAPEGVAQNYPPVFSYVGDATIDDPDSGWWVVVLTEMVGKTASFVLQCTITTGCGHLVPTWCVFVNNWTYIPCWDAKPIFGIRRACESY